MNKADLRKIYLARQKNLPPAEREAKSRAIAESFFRVFDLDGINFLHLFLPIEKFGEIETSFIFGKIRRDFPAIRLIVPRVDFQTMEMENLEFAPETELVKNAWHIFEPAHDCFVETEKIDMVLVPLLCFDRRGFRAGYGKGFYDRFLSRCRPDCRKIGLSYFPPVEEIADADDFDVKLDFCITPEKIFDFRREP